MWGVWPTVTESNREALTQRYHDDRNELLASNNYLDVGGRTYQLLPTEADDNTGRNDNYRGHTFQLWADGLPTPHFLNYHHDEELDSGDFGFIQKSVNDARRAGLYLQPATDAPSPMFTRNYPTRPPNSGYTSGYLPYGLGKFDARQSRGDKSYSLLDRDMHHYSIDTPPEALGRHPKELNAKYAGANDPTHSTTTPRGEAMDPIQAAVLRGDNPKSRMITSGESKLARAIESRATATHTYPPKKDEL